MGPRRLRTEVALPSVCWPLAGGTVWTPFPPAGLGGSPGGGRAPATRRPAVGEGTPAHGSLSRPQEQFEFALTAVAEEVNTILQALPQ